MKNFDGHKLDTRSKKCRFVSYPKKSTEYYFYNPTQQKMFVDRHVIFLEKQFIQGGSGRTDELEKVQNLQSIQDSPNGSQPDVPIVEAQPLHTPPLRRSSRVHSVLLRYGFVIENDNTTHIIENDDPMTFSEAVMSSDSNK